MSAHPTSTQINCLHMCWLVGVSSLSCNDTRLPWPFFCDVICKRSMRPSHGKLPTVTRRTTCCIAYHLDKQHPYQTQTYKNNMTHRPTARPKLQNALTHRPTRRPKLLNAMAHRPATTFMTSPIINFNQ